MLDEQYVDPSRVNFEAKALDRQRYPHANKLKFYDQAL